MFILPSLSFFSPPPLIISYFPLPIPIFSSFLFITLSHVLLPFFYFFFIILLPLENHRERRKYFFLKPNYDFSTVARKRKTLLPIFPRLFFAIFSLRNISPCYIFHERKRNEAGQVSRREKRQNEENCGRRGNGKNETKAVRFVKGEMPWVGRIRDRCTIFAVASRPHQGLFHPRRTRVK